MRKCDSNGFRHEYPPVLSLAVPVERLAFTDVLGKLVGVILSRSVGVGVLFRPICSSLGHPL